MHVSGSVLYLPGREGVISVSRCVWRHTYRLGQLTWGNERAGLKGRGGAERGRAGQGRGCGGVMDHGSQAMAQQIWCFDPFTG